MLYTENKKEKLFLTSSNHENMERMKFDETAKIATPAPSARDLSTTFTC